MKYEDNFQSELDELLDAYNISKVEILKHYLAFIQRRDMPRLLAHYEIFKLVQHLPGSICEIGVYYGSGLFTWAHFLESFCTGDRVRKVYGFDDFSGYSRFTKEDGISKQFIEDKNHALKSNSEFLIKLNNLHNSDNLLKGVERSVIIPGDIKETVPKFVNENNGLRLCLLYLDANLYEPTKTAIEYLYPLVVPGGVVAFNGYGQTPWSGESQAIEELFSTFNYFPKLKRFSFSNIPSGYFLKTSNHTETEPVNA
ncbi:MAG: TylF/MycF/NovP-related O-methyltransferase [Lamprobacter sp.]|uniref:TylF/MycF/NovP-related O-methyltransferase n=1 Tax=Lamprobacter sp. TaxID=3100796 RepID=UPI002B2633DA|nr:TylF/MycF/NovP-related O-methyltransferase [Lamprobacter sp.]MEA3642700.1 TylF/MycF/NovP-related O-methyltransferase [Lamprobacter sp.]